MCQFSLVIDEDFIIDINLNCDKWAIFNGLQYYSLLVNIFSSNNTEKFYFFQTYSTIKFKYALLLAFSISLYANKFPLFMVLVCCTQRIFASTNSHQKFDNFGMKRKYTTRKMMPLPSRSHLKKKKKKLNDQNEYFWAIKKDLLLSCSNEEFVYVYIW